MLQPKHITADIAAHQLRAGAEPGLELSIVVPVYNERDNVRPLVEALHRALTGRSWEVIFVDDDSPDGTAELVRELGRQDRRVRCIRRIGRRGLSSACIEGMLASTARYLAVMDGDLQHDETLLARMLDVLDSGQVDLVVGSRYTSGGGIGSWRPVRTRMSRIATRISDAVLRAPLSDPMSGLFMVRYEAFAERARKLSGVGFKILLDLFLSGERPPRFRELAYRFRGRRAGESKLDARAVWDFLMLLLDKRLGGVVPVRFFAFALVGSLGVAVHLAAMWVLLKGVGISFPAAQLGASLCAMTSNFAINNVLTFRDLRLRGTRWLVGWASFAFACSVGMLANVGIASYLFATRTTWLVASLAGTLVGAVWNYAISSAFTWRVRSAG